MIYSETTIYRLAECFHEKWRAGREKAGLTERIKSFVIDGDLVKINILVPWGDLPEVAKFDNLAAARVALELYSSCGTDLGAAGHKIHEEWVLRNRETVKDDPTRQHLLCNFDKLSPEEQEKDLEQYRIVLEFNENNTPNV